MACSGSSNAAALIAVVTGWLSLITYMLAL
jgi:hypothetical protein